MTNIEDKVIEETKTEAGCASLIWGSAGSLVYGFVYTRP